MVKTALSQCFGNLVQKKAEKRQKVPKFIKKLFIKKSKLSKNLMKTKCVIKLDKLCEKLK